MPVLVAGALGQQPGGTASSSNGGTVVQQESSSVHPGSGGKDPGVGAITLESNESLFDVVVALNACGYDADLADSHPVRGEVRADVEAAVSGPAGVKAKAAEDKLCGYIHEHELSDKGRELAQYVSLGLYLTPPPALTTIADETDMPPDALAVVNVLPMLRGFAEAAGLHLIWLKHHAEYEAITNALHEPVRDVVFGTNAYLKIPLSTYQDRRLLVLVEPMLAPNAPNARIYSTDYVVVTSPTAAGAVRMDQIRHIYLHYTIEPLVYARANSMLRLTPLLKPVADAPLEYEYRTDVVALVTECMIKAIEARRMDTGIPVPAKPNGPKDRAVDERYTEELTAYDRNSEQVRRKQVDLDMREGWSLTMYFYEQMLLLERNPEGLNDSMGQMVYGMDVAREQKRDSQIQFLPVGSSEYVRRAPRVPTGLMLGEKLLLEGKVDAAEELAQKLLADPKVDHAQALFLEARVDLMKRDGESARDELALVIKTAHDPKTQAWAHVYLGRLEDTKDEPNRAAAVKEYKAALGVPGVPVDAKAAAEKGVAAPFTVPKVKGAEEELDPTGKAEKEAYRPPKT